MYKSLEQLELELDMLTNNLDIAFNTEEKLQALIQGEDLDFTGYIIAKDGSIINQTEFSFETMLPPSADIYLEAFIKMNLYDNNLERAIAALS